MKNILLILLVFITANCYGQNSNYQLQLKHSTFTPDEHTSNFNWKTFYNSISPVNEQRFVLIQFYQTPHQLQKDQLKTAGIFLHDYVTANTFTASIHHQPEIHLKSFGVRSITVLPIAAKINPTLLQGHFPAHAIKQPNTIDVDVQLSKGILVTDAIELLGKKGFMIINNRFNNNHIVGLRLSQQKLTDLIELPFVEYVSATLPADRLLNDELRSNARANILNAPLIDGGEHLNGSGVTIGHGDDGDITSHIDLKDRVINHTLGYPFSHATQTAGSAAGAGIKDPLYKGIAPKANLIAQNFGNILWNAPAYVTDYNMVITNNSYGAVLSECDYAGVYDAYSKVLDEQAFSLPNLLHVFATGNDGSITCGNYPQGYKTVVGAYQSAKNAIDVAWGDKNATVSTGSSYGPVADGRLKPDIAATGSAVRSPGTNNNYVTDWGSSLAAPAVTGGAALLIEKYKQLHSNTNPKSGLIKALLLNGATDIGIPGPDFKCGYGWLNLVRSLNMLQQNRFITGAINHSIENTHAIIVPSGTSKLKVMLYWHDPAAVVFAQQTLVNDVDLKLITPTATTVLPWILNPSAATVSNPATRGFDRINNTEQVTIDNPAAGTYQIKVNGFAINTNPLQEYFIVYDFINEGLHLTFPAVGEPLVPNETVTINWDANGNSAETFTLQYSTDNGTNWVNIATGLSSTQRQFIWPVPSTITHQAKVRIQWGSSGLADTSKVFAVIQQPIVSNTAITDQCFGYAIFNWSAVVGATDYEVLVKDVSGTLVHQAFTTNTSYTIRGIAIDQKVWVAVRARINGVAGRQSIGVEIDGNNNGQCIGINGDGDLMLTQFNAVSGRQGTSTALTNTVQFSGTIKNIGDTSLNNPKVFVQINNAAAIEVSTWSSVAATALLNFTTPSIFNLSNAGSYTVKSFISHATTDPFAGNDTLTTVVKQLANPPITLPLLEDFETATSNAYQTNTIGLSGLDKWDYNNNGNYGRARTFVNTGIAKSGSKAITLDVSAYSATGSENSLTGTFNLSNYDTALHDIRLTFWFKHHGQVNNSFNKVWIRGNDTAPWIQVYDLDQHKPYLAGEWKLASSIEITDVLKSNQQQFSTSFQIKFVQKGNFSMGDDKSTEGFTFDDIQLFEVQNDVAAITITNPNQQSCELGFAETIKVNIKNNSAFNLTNIPVYAQLNGGTVISTTIASLSSNTVAQVIFPTTIDFSALGQHNLKVWTGLSSDTYKANDTITIVLVNQPIITVFPYLQQFENGSGNWYANGENSSWEFGTPASLKINKAASGIKAWKTTLKGNYNDNEKSYLYSPCFDISGLSHPWFSASMAIDLEQCSQSVCDKAWVEYSADGISWLKLGAFNQGYNWYNRNGDQVWDSASFTRWHVVSIPLPTGLQNLRLRFVMQSEIAVVREGIAIDDIHIYNRPNEMYSGASMVNPVSQFLNGNVWVDFLQAGKLIASVNPANNNLGSTAIQTFIHTGGFGAVRHSNSLYYLNRNITIQPTNTNPIDSVSIRYYFTDAEVDTLTRAIGCNNCRKPIDAYDLGITTYDDVNNAIENGTLTDNASGIYNYITKANISIIPFEKGYYAEFKRKSFSEFWLSDGNIGNAPPLPLLLTSFDAVKVADKVNVTWQTSNEIGVDYFEVQVSGDNNPANFKVLAMVSAKNALVNQYSFIDRQLGLSAVKYYRLKVVHKDGSFTYSNVRVVYFENNARWVVMPNPIKDEILLSSATVLHEAIQIQLLDSKGALLLQQHHVGGRNNIIIPIASLQLSSGVYSVVIHDRMGTQVLKIVKL